MSSLMKLNEQKRDVNEEIVKFSESHNQFMVRMMMRSQDSL